jgi:hypothetical protein
MTRKDLQLGAWLANHRQRPLRPQASVAERPLELPPVERREPAVADTFSMALAEFYAISRRAGATRRDIQETMHKTQRLIHESRELMARLDKPPNGRSASMGDGDAGPPTASLSRQTLYRTKLTIAIS